jgi:UDP-apiose/xylose synthase
MAVSAPKTICILGCGGFIGSHLVERILAGTDWYVLGIDRSSAKIDGCLSDPRFTFAKADVDSPGVADGFIGRSDIVVSLVALCNPSLYNTIPLEVIKSNFTRPMAIVETCSRLKKWLVHFSTCEVYGTTVSHAAQRPFDPRTDIFSEDATPLVLGPVSAQRWTYACAKQLLERAIFAHGFEHGLEYTIVRPFNFIGPRMDFLPGTCGVEGVPRVLACFMDALLSGKPLKLVDGGINFRSFTYIDDAIDALMAILSQPEKAKGRIFNIGNPANETTIAGLAELMIRIYRELRPESAGSPAVIQTVASTEFYGEGYEDSDRRIPDISKAQTLLSWKPMTSLAEAMRMTMAHYIREYGGAHTDSCAHACREAI